MPEDRSLEIAQGFAAIARELMAADGVKQTLDLVVHLACASIEGCDHAAVSLRTERGLVTPASTSEVPGKVDAIEYETGQGPCVDAIRSHDVFVTEDLAREDRWPAFSGRAAHETGVHSMLSFKLFTEEDTMGALNLYSESIGAFTELAEAFGVVFAAHAAIALSAARSEESLERAVESRDLIGEAKGILVERRHVAPREAFEILRRASQSRNIKLLEVAAQLVETGTDPEVDDA
jgi:GAF domain-containing protein